MTIDEKLEGLTVDLRSAEESDAEYTWRIRREDKAAFVHRLSGTVEDQALWLRRQAESTDSFFFIVMDKSGKPLGTISIYDITEHDAEEGRTLMFGTPVQNAEAFILAYDFAFDVLGLESTHSCVFVDNVRVIGIPEKLGARIVGERHNDEFGMTQRFFRLRREDYAAARGRIHTLIRRFSGRG